MQRCFGRVLQSTCSISAAARRLSASGSASLGGIRSSSTTFHSKLRSSLPGVTTAPPLLPRPMPSAVARLSFALGLSAPWHLTQRHLKQGDDFLGDGRRGAAFSSAPEAAGEKGNPNNQATQAHPHREGLSESTGGRGPDCRIVDYPDPTDNHLIVDYPDPTDNHLIAAKDIIRISPKKSECAGPSFCTL